MRGACGRRPGVPIRSPEPPLAVHLHLAAAPRPCTPPPQVLLSSRNNILQGEERVLEVVDRHTSVRACV